MIYIHIPFCDKKCYYCNFVSYANFSLVEEYFEALEKEIVKRKTYKPISSVFIGGGTPSSVDAKQIARIMQVVKQNYTLTQDCEITIELNPRSTTKEKLETYFYCGINRVSFGVQTLNEQQLEVLGREQTQKQVFEAIENAKAVGFKRISADLMLGLENQTKEEVVFNAKTLLNLGIEHISAYMLILEEHTKLWQLVNQGKVVLPSDDQTVEIYDALYEFLKSKGFERYEISNFALPGALSRHNLGYWQMKEYLGFGVAAHSFIDGKRLENSKNIKFYIEGKDIKEEIITKAQENEERIMLGLRTAFGVGEEYIENKEALQEMLKEKFVKNQDGNIIIEEDKFGVTNAIILQLIS